MMFSNFDRRFFILPAILLVAVWILQPVHVVSAQSLPPTDNSCLTCHEDLYYLHDTGKWYCIVEHQDRCVNCHAGDPTTLNKEASHQGLILYPQQNDGEKCLECHQQDAQARLAEFAAMGGYKEVVEYVAHVPSQTIQTGPPNVPEANELLDNLPWAAGIAVVFGLWLLLVLFSPTKP